MTDLLKLDETEQRDLPMAQAYVQSRFFPPLPSEYGALAIIAVREYREYGAESHVNLPSDLNPLPAAAREDDDGDLFVEAGELIRILHLEHMIEEEDDDEPVCESCGGTYDVAYRYGRVLCSPCTDALDAGDDE